MHTHARKVNEYKIKQATINISNQKLEMASVGPQGLVQVTLCCLLSVPHPALSVGKSDCAFKLN